MLCNKEENVTGTRKALIISEYDYATTLQSRLLQKRWGRNL